MTNDAAQLADLMFAAELARIPPQDFGRLLATAERVDALTSLPVTLPSSPCRALVCSADAARLFNGQLLGCWRGRAFLTWPKERAT